jgi:hypothetical protein
MKLQEPKEVDLLIMLRDEIKSGGMTTTIVGGDLRVMSKLSRPIVMWVVGNRLYLAKSQQHSQRWYMDITDPIRNPQIIIEMFKSWAVSQSKLLSILKKDV